MEEWQKHFIDKNSVGLLENIIPSDVFLAYLREKDVLSSEEFNDARSYLGPPLHSTRLVSYIIGIVTTRIGGFFGLLHALRKTNQRKAVEILESSSLIAILESTLTVNGVERSLKDCFPTLVKFNIKKLLAEPKFKEDFISIFENGSGKLQIFEHGIPEKYTSKIYVPRLISNRVTVEKDLFQVDCKDIFVFTGIRRHKLTNLVRQNCGTSTSSTEIMNFKISARYVVLEDDEHWDSLREIANVPMHWIRVENRSVYNLIPEYVIVGTTGISSLVQKYISNKLHSTEASVTQGEFVKTLVMSEKTKGVCICDEPGMGKSWLLANMAQELTSETSCICCFVPISDFMNKLQQKVVSDESAIRAILSYTRDSALSAEIIFYLIQESKLRLECFFDGYDELSSNQQEIADSLIKNLNQPRNIRVFVTGRPHMRRHLEALLGSTAYDIIPFTTSQQMQYLTAHWQENLPKTGLACTSTHVNRLQQFANIIIQRFPSVKQDSEVGGLGIPLKCFLLAEVYAQLATRFAKMQTVRLESVTTTNHRALLANLFSKYLDLGLEKSAKSKRDKSFREVLVALHIRKAMHLIFPNYTYTDVDIEHEQIDELDILAPGFLQKTSCGFEFFHRMFAEFLVARRFAEDVAKEEWEKPLVTFLFTEFLACQDKKPNDYTLLEQFHPNIALPWLKRNAGLHVKYFKSCTFVNAPLLDFFNVMLENNLVLESFVCQNLFEGIEETTLFRILLASTRQNLSNVLRLLFWRIESNVALFAKAKTIFLHKKFGDDAFYCCWQMLVAASKYGGREISEQVTNFLLETMKTGNIFERMPEWMMTPLHHAIRKGDYASTEYFHSCITLQDRCLLYYGIFNSVYDSPNVVRSKDEIIRMLVSKDDTLLDESSLYSDYIKRVSIEIRKLSGPICVEGIHLDLIKVLVNLGANVCAKDWDSRNFLVNAALVPSCQENFDNLLRFLNINVQPSVINELVKTKYFTKPALQRQIDYWFDLPCDFIEKILKTPGFDVNQRDRDGIPLIHFSQYPAVTQLLISHGADINAISERASDILSGREVGERYGALRRCRIPKQKGYWENGNTLRRNAAHSVSTRCTDAEKYYKWTTYMMNEGHSKFWKSEDVRGTTPLEYAVQAGDVKKECIELIISQTRLCINSRRFGKQSLVELAVERGTLNTLKALTACGADWKGRRLLRLSMDRGDIDIIDFILDQEGVSVSDVGYYPPIHLVALRPDPVQLTTILMKHGADLFAKDTIGNTVAHFVRWDLHRYVKWKEYIVSIGKGDLFRIRNNDNILPDDVLRRHWYR